MDYRNDSELKREISERKKDGYRMILFVSGQCSQKTRVEGISFLIGHLLDTEPQIDEFVHKNRVCAALYVPIKHSTEATEMAKRYIESESDQKLDPEGKILEKTGTETRLARI